MFSMNCVIYIEWINLFSNLNADQIFVLGPTYMHHMYSYERHMVVMKVYVRNRAHPEGSMIEGYTTKEVIECCVDYMKDGSPIGVPVS
jgi:hypothetical protein